LPTTLPGNGSIAVDETRNTIYLTKFDPAPGALYVVDGAGACGTFLSAITVSSNPKSVAVDPGTNKIYVGHGSFFGRTKLTVIDGATSVASDCTDVGTGQDSMWINPASGTGYVARSAAGAVDVFPLSCGALIKEFFPGVGPGLITGNPALGTLFVPSSGDIVLLIDIKAGSPTINKVYAAYVMKGAPIATGVDTANGHVFTSLNTRAVVTELIAGGN